MRYGERMHNQIVDLKGQTGCEGSDFMNRLGQGCDMFNFAVDINRQQQLAREHTDGLNMVAVFMGNQDRIDFFWIETPRL
jgi:hypothetical protein